MHQAYITLIAVVFPIIVSLASALYRVIMEHMPSTQRAAVLTVAQSVKSIAATVVQGVEQSGNTLQWTNAEKKSAAVAAVKEIVAAHHLTVPATLIDFAIEAAVAYLADTHATTVPLPAPTLAL